MIDCKDITLFITAWSIIGILFHFWPALTFLVLMAIVTVGLLQRAIDMLWGLLPK